MFSIGSDDGVLPWVLESLKQILDQFPQEEIGLWDRGFYAWPGFNGGQENMFQIPQKYIQGQVGAYFNKTSDIFEWITEDQQAIYIMPTLYINSGFRRQYLKTLLEKTGKLLDGCNQDIQTGVINCCIQKNVLRVAYPITIAGMSPASIGYLENEAEHKKIQNANQNAREKVFQWENKGVWIPETRSRQVPQIGLDTCGVYFVLSQAVQEGLMTADQADHILDWKTATLRICQTYSVMREEYDRCAHTLHSAAKKLGEASWFENTVLKNILAPRQFDEQKIEQCLAQKNYQEGETQCH